jgi:hypothetical protein
MTLGNTPNIRLYFSSYENDPVYGLSLLGNGDTDDKNNIIGYEREFRDYIGKWTFFSIAYHKELKADDGVTFFPKMIKFEINTNSLTTDTSKIVNEPKFDRITIDQGYFGLFEGIKYYTEFIIQAITYEIPNLNMQKPFQMPGLQRSIHESTSDIGLICQQDGRYIDNRLIKS